jgi:hypothetical protein
VDWVATHGWKLLPYYEFDAVTGDWRHQDWQAHAPMSLHEIRFEDGALRFSSHHTEAGEDAFDEYFRAADQILARAEAEVPDLVLEPTPLEPDFERMRWFPLAHEVVARLRSERAAVG